MQYSLIWPVAVALVDGDFDVAGVLAEFSNADVAAVAARTEVRVDELMTAAFPARRVTRLVVRLRSGEELDSGVVEAPGEPGDPGWHAVIEHKARRYLDAEAAHPAVRTIDPPAASLAGRDAQQLTALLAYGLGSAAEQKGP
jgi:2-methylcitrate dehydratase PrpD